MSYLITKCYTTVQNYFSIKIILELRPIWPRPWAHGLIIMRIQFNFFPWAKVLENS